MLDTNTARQHGNYFPMPNVIYDLGLSSGAISTYGFLLRFENRRCGDKDQHTCYPSQRTIGEAIARNRKTVGKYIEELCEMGLISIEPTTVTTADGQRWNGNLKYTLLDPQHAVKLRYERQLAELDRARERARVRDHLEKQRKAMERGKQTRARNQIPHTEYIAARSAHEPEELPF